MSALPNDHQALLNKPGDHVVITFWNDSIWFLLIEYQNFPHVMILQCELAGGSLSDIWRKTLDSTLFHQPNIPTSFHPSFILTPLYPRDKVQHGVRESKIPHFRVEIGVAPEQWGLRRTQLLLDMVTWWQWPWRPCWAWGLMRKCSQTPQLQRRWQHQV